MPKNNTPIRLVKSPNQWIDLDQTIEDCVRAICARYDDREQTRSFLTLLDLMTNCKYDQGDRENVAFHAQRVAFHYTEECDNAQQSYMNGLVVSEERKTA